MFRLALHRFTLGITLLLGVFAAQQAFPKAHPVPTARQTTRAATKRPLRMLALGDSVMWGQGLIEKNKFSYKLRDWLCAQRGTTECQNNQYVQLHVEAHSGAIVSKPKKKREEETEGRFIRTVTPLRYAGEVNNGYPTLWGQLNLARRHYQNSSVPPGEVDLILVNGCINDINATKLLVHRLIGGNVRKLAKRYCYDEMKRFLPEVADAFPNARIVVPGYFPLISESTPPHILIGTVKEWIFGGKETDAELAEAFQEDWSTEPGGNADAAKTTRIMKGLAARSREFVHESNNALEAAVKHLNDHRPLSPSSNTSSAAQPPEASARGLFVSIPFGDENAYAAPNTFLWKLGRKNPTLVLECADDNFVTRFVVNDEMQRERPCMCDQAGRKNDPVCFRAGAFHPNREGADAYFNAIRQKLENIISFTGWTAKD